MAGPTVELRLPRVVLILYAAMAIGLSLVLLLLARDRGVSEIALRLAAYAAIGLFSFYRPQAAPLGAGFLALLLGFVKTYHGGLNIDLGLGLIAIAVARHAFARARQGEEDRRIDLGGACLLAIAVWSAISLAFSVGRIQAFVPAPGFDHHIYKFNSSGFSSEQATLQAIWGATMSFVWFGLYEWARSFRAERRTLGIAVFVVMAANAAVIVIQQHVYPRFLHPIGFPLVGRAGGLTSFCYALADAVLSLFLLLPVWGVAAGPLLAMTGASVLMLTYAAFASGSRTALCAMLLAALLWIGRRAFTRDAARRIARSVWLTGLALLLVVAAAAYRATPPNPASPIGRLKDGIARQGLAGHLFATRLNSYPLIARVMAEYPLSGVGAGLYMAEVRKLHALLMPELPILDPYLLSSYAPNQFLNVGVELGIPAMLALVLAFLSALLIALRERRYDLAVSVLAIAAALQFGPELYNSEGVVFFWLVVGLAAQRAARPEEARRTRVTTLVLIAVALVGIGGQLMALRSLSVESQWKRLRWHMSVGLYPSQPAGRWTAPQASFVVKTEEPQWVVRWHVGDRSAPDYRADVRFYVDGTLVERALASPGVVRESHLPLPAVKGLKRISVRVTPPFVKGHPPDEQTFGIFIHSAGALGDAGNP